MSWREAHDLDGDVDGAAAPLPRTRLDDLSRGTHVAGLLARGWPGAVVDLDAEMSAGMDGVMRMPVTGRHPPDTPRGWSPAWWGLGAALTALLAALAVMLVYGLVLEYGGDLRTVCGVAVVVAVFVAASTWFLLQILGPGRPAGAGLWVVATAAGAAVATLAVGWIAQNRFGSEIHAQDTGCTPARIAELAALDLPGRAESPAGQRDGRCLGMPVVPGSVGTADAVLHAALAAHGWILDGADDGHPRWRKDPYTLVVYEPYEMADGTMLRLGIR